MKLAKGCFVFALVLVMLLAVTASPEARILMTGSVNQFVFSVMPTSRFTVDDWLSNPNLWTITISNSADGKTVVEMKMHILINSPQYPIISQGTLNIVRKTKSFLTELLPGGTFIVTNTMVQEGKGQMDSGDWSEDFVNEVTRIGYLPEGSYRLKFSLNGNYSDGSKFGEDDMLTIDEEIDVRNPLPPELITPEDRSEDVVAIPRFTWQRPTVTDLSAINNTRIEIKYTLRLYKMFENDGTSLSEQEAITRIPIWTVSDLRMTESLIFDPGTSREELISGRKYCWQVQAFDGLGRFISAKNDGKSDLWDFTVQFELPVINEPQVFFPLNVTWSPARSGGATVSYRVRIADNPDYANAYVQTGLTMTSFIYPDEAPPLRYGATLYCEVQTTDDRGIPLGTPVRISFQIPQAEVTLVAPQNDSQMPSMTPVFEWTGNSMFYVVTISAENSDWTFSSGAVQGTRWMYDGPPFARGARYLWNAAPANQNGDPTGASSESWVFSTPGEGQVTIVSPVNQMVETIFPTFIWDEVPAPEGGSITYRLTVSSVAESGEAAVVHTAEVTTTEYRYPEDAEMLKYGARYTWTVSAVSNGQEIGTPSVPAWFTTPFVKPEGETVTMDDISKAIMLVLSNFPGFDEFKDKVIASVSDETGPLTPDRLLEIINTSKIVKVKIK